MGPGSLRGSIFTVIAAAVGAGILGLPYIAYRAGLGNALILLTIGMLGNIWSCNILGDLCFYTKSSQYYKISEIIGGNAMSYLYSFTVIVQQTGTVTGYQIISNKLILITIDADILFEFIKHFGFEDIPDRIYLRAAFVLIPSIWIHFPYSRKKNITSLRYCSLFGMIAMYFTISIVMAEGFYFLCKGALQQAVWFKFDHSLFRCYGFTIFAYVCQPNLLPVIDDLAFKSESRVKTVSI